MTQSFLYWFIFPGIRDNNIYCDGFSSIILFRLIESVLFSEALKFVHTDASNKAEVIKIEPDERPSKDVLISASNCGIPTLDDLFAGSFFN